MRLILTLNVTVKSELLQLVRHVTRPRPDRVHIVASGGRAQPLDSAVEAGGMDQDRAQDGAVAHSHELLSRPLLSFPALALASNSAWSQYLGHAPTGRLFKVSEYELHLFREGDGSPTVMYDSALGGNYHSTGHACNRQTGADSARH